MREYSDKRLVVTYPDEVVAMFGMNVIRLTALVTESESVLMTVRNEASGKEVSEQRAAWDSTEYGTYEFSLSYALQVLFEQDKLGVVDYDNAMSDEGMSAWYSVNLVLYQGGGTYATFEFRVLGLWAVKLPDAEQRLKRWHGWPFSVSLFTPSKSLEGYSESVTYRIGADVVGEVIVSTAEQSVSVESVDCGGEGIYLRWIDVYGRYRYWLFKSGDAPMDVQSDGELMRSVRDGVRMMRRSSKTAGRSLKVCAPMVDRDTFVMLDGLRYSPVVDMYSGGEWVAVDIKAESVTMTKDEVQDFILTVLFAEEEVQRL